MSIKNAGNRTGAGVLRGIENWGEKVLPVGTGGAVETQIQLLSDFGKRAGLKGIQEWMSFFFKSPMVAKGLYAENNLFIQEMKLKNTLRYLMGESEITHTGMDYYE